MSTTEFAKKDSFIEESERWPVADIPPILEKKRLEPKQVFRSMVRQGRHRQQSGLLWSQIEQWANELEPIFSSEEFHLPSPIRFRQSKSPETPQLPGTPEDHSRQSLDDLANFLENASQIALARLAVTLKKKNLGSAKLRRWRELLDRILQDYIHEDQRLILETFEGFVDQIINGTAHVTLKSEHGDILYGEYNANELAQQGIFERRRFICRTIAIDDGIRVELAPVPETELTDAEEDAISQDVDALVVENDLDGDY